MSTEKETKIPTSQATQEETPWVAIFRAGKYPQGEYTQRDLDEMVTNYDPDHAHEAPISTDHEHAGPAQGWVSQLKRDGNLLYAKFRQVSDEFRSQIREGRYKKPSAEIHPNYEGSGKKYLYAVTFLGAQVPQIKGLPAAAFSDGNAVKETIIISFQEEENMPDTPLATILADREAELARFREDKTAKEKALQEKDAEIAQFREKQKSDGEALKAKDEELARVKADNEKKEIKSFFEGQIKEGKAIPAWVNAGIVEFAQSLDSGANQELAKFAEAKEGQTPTMSQREWFKRFVAGLPAVVNFKEIIITDKAPHGQVSGDTGARLHDLTVRKMNEHKDLNYRQAFSEVQKENPILAMKYMESAPEANNS